jgi:hypothetical protein
MGDRLGQMLPRRRVREGLTKALPKEHSHVTLARRVRVTVRGPDP